MNINNNPNLIEPGVKYFISGTLKECRKFKDKYYNNIYNIITLILLIITIVVILIFRYKGNISKIEIKKQNIKKHEYIISKLQQLAHYKNNLNKKTNMITDLPLWS